MARARVETIFMNNKLRNFTYLVEGKKDEYYCIDPYDAELIEARLKKIGGRLIGILNTHQHHDHICGNPALLENYDIELYAHEKASYQRSFKKLAEGDRIELNPDNEILVWDTPGHTMTHLMFLLIYQEKIWGVMSGDTVFNAGVGHCRLGGDPDILYQTIAQRVSQISNEVILYPGHEYMGNNLKFSHDRNLQNIKTKSLLERWSQTDWMKEPWQTTLEQEREVNAFLCLSEIEIQNSLPVPTHDEKQVFLQLRELRNNW